MFPLLDRALKYVVKTGTLKVTDAAGQSHTFGDGTGTPVGFRLTDSKWETRIALDPDRFLGEAYMAGGLELEQGTIYEVLELLLKNLEGRKQPAAFRLFNQVRIALKRLDQYNAECCAPLRSFGRALRSIPRSRPAIFLRIF
jgi:cyclopropane-fatty-acyl-phospholipid synthase